VIRSVGGTAEDVPVIEAEAGGRDGAGQPGHGRHSQLAVFLAVLGDVAFTGAVAVHVAFADASVAAAVLVGAAALAFVAATVVALVARRRAAVAVAAAVIALAGLAAAVEAVAAARRYDDLRRQAFGDRAGVRLVEPGSAQGRRMGGAMLSSISASVAAITAFPLAGYLAVSTLRTGRAP
jgi:hypothetical protein